jgi:hypothetical protein
MSRDYLDIGNGNDFTKTVIEKTGDFPSYGDTITTNPEMNFVMVVFGTCQSTGPF